MTRLTDKQSLHDPVRDDERRHAPDQNEKRREEESSDWSPAGCDTELSVQLSHSLLDPVDDLPGVNQSAARGGRGAVVDASGAAGYSL